jgi:hypothetical protein
MAVAMGGQKRPPNTMSGQRGDGQPHPLGAHPAIEGDAREVTPAHVLQSALEDEEDANRAGPGVELVDERLELALEVQPR